MRNRRLAIAGLALVASLGLTGCGPSGTSTGGSDSAAAAQTKKPVDPAAELAAAATKLSTVSLKVKMKSAAGLNAEGSANAGGEQMEMTMTLGASGSDDTTMTMRKVGNDVYLKMDGALGSALGAKTDKWMHVDASTIPEGSPFSISGSGPTDASKMIAATTNVEKTGEGAYKGVLDMTKTPNANDKALETLGAKAKTVPFTAKTDAEGRLTELAIDMDSMMSGAGKMTTTYSDFGTPVSVKAPPAKDVQEMPKSMLGAANA
jgi:hypothetical protein